MARIFMVYSSRLGCLRRSFVAVQQKEMHDRCHPEYAREFLAPHSVFHSQL